MALLQATILRAGVGPGSSSLIIEYDDKTLAVSKFHIKSDDTKRSFSVELSKGQTIFKTTAPPKLDATINVALAIPPNQVFIRKTGKEPEDIDFDIRFLTSQRA